MTATGCAPWIRLIFEGLSTFIPARLMKAEARRESGDCFAKNDFWIPAFACMTLSKAGSYETRQRFWARSGAIWKLPWPSWPVGFLWEYRAPAGEVAFKPPLGERNERQGGQAPLNPLLLSRSFPSRAPDFSSGKCSTSLTEKILRVKWRWRIMPSSI